MSRQAYVYLPKQLLFFWSPKCGNTSLGDFIFKNLEVDDAYHKNARKFLSNANSKVGFKLAWKLINDHVFTGIVLSRNPYNRAVSAYLNKFVINRKKWIQNPDCMEGFSRKLFNQAKKYNNDFLPLGISFDDYLTHISCVLDQKKPLDPHFNTQVPFFLKDKNYYKHQLRLESIDQDLVLLYELGFTGEFKKLRSTAPLDANIPSNSEDLSNMPSFVLAREKIQPKFENLINKKTASLIEKIYAIDFEILNYSPINYR